MMTEATIQKYVEDLLGKISFAGEVSVQKDENRYQVSIVSNEGGLLIGQGGANIVALQHLLRLCVRKELEGTETTIYLDVNGYWKEKEKVLEEEAVEAAKRARTEGHNVVLRSMNAHERKIVHDRLATEEGVSTESTGIGPDRRVVVKKIS